MAIIIILYIADKSEKDTAQLRAIINTILQQYNLMNSELYLADYLGRVLLCLTIIINPKPDEKYQAMQDHGT